MKKLPVRWHKEGEISNIYAQSNAWIYIRSPIMSWIMSLPKDVKVPGPVPVWPYLKNKIFACDQARMRLLGHSQSSVCSVVSDSLQPHGLQPARIFHPCGVFQARILEWVAISFFRGSFELRDWTSVSCVCCIGRQVLHHWATREAPEVIRVGPNPKWLCALKKGKFRPRDRHTENKTKHSSWRWKQRLGWYSYKPRKAKDSQQPSRSWERTHATISSSQPSEEVNLAS